MQACSTYSITTSWSIELIPEGTPRNSVAIERLVSVEYRIIAVPAKKDDILGLADQTTKNTVYEKQ